MPRVWGDIWLIAFITGPIRKILTHLGEPLEPPAGSPARGRPTDWAELVQFREAAVTAGVSCDLIIVEGAPHTFHLQPAQQDLRSVVIEFFDRHLKLH